MLLAVLAAVIGFGLTNLVRNTGAALGIGFVYVLIIETAVRIMQPTWVPWLLGNNAVALVQHEGLTLEIYDTSGMVASGEPTFYFLGHLQSGVFLGAVALVLVGVGGYLFATRDIH